jgi:hypothetical protein
MGTKDNASARCKKGKVEWTTTSRLPEGAVSVSASSRSLVGTPSSRSRSSFGSKPDE